MHPRPILLLRSSRRRGSVLIVALLFSLVIAISLASFLNISTQASQLSYRTFYQGVAMNIAESGLEQALWEINKDSSYAWSGWESVTKKILAEMERGFTRQRTATYVAGSGDQMIDIGITITWKGVDGVAHKRTSSTRYCKNGLYNYYYTLNKSSS